MALTHLKAADHRVMPWKNGLGSTTEIAVFPPGASVEDFGWRVSAADVAADGPFSAFPGIDRTLSILDGDGLTLFVGNAEGRVLRQDTAPFAFPADVPTSADLVDGPIADLNVMTRRGVWQHAVERVIVEAFTEIEASAAITLIYSRGAAVRLSGPRGEALMQAGDAVFLEGTDHWTVSAAKPATLFIISINPAA